MGNKESTSRTTSKAKTNKKQLVLTSEELRLRISVEVVSEGPLQQLYSFGSKSEPVMIAYADQSSFMALSRSGYLISQNEQVIATRKVNNNQFGKKHKAKQISAKLT